jgi:hypothetical protein
VNNTNGENYNTQNIKDLERNIENLKSEIIILQSKLLHNELEKNNSEKSNSKINLPNINITADQTEPNVSYNNYQNRLYFSSWGGAYSNAVTFRDAMRIFEKLKQQLAIIGVKADDIQSAQDDINDQISAKKDELTNIEEKAKEMFLIFQKEYEERKTLAPTVLEKVDEFADANDEYLTKFLNPITSQTPKLNVTEDKTTKEVEPIVIEKITKDVIFVEPKKAGKPKGVSDISSVKPKKSKTDLEFLQEKLEATQDLIDIFEMTDGDSKDLEYLKSLLETTKDLMSLMELA